METVNSRWLSGTYEMLLMEDEEEADILVLSIWAKATDVDDEEADEDAPLLYQADIPWSAIPSVPNTFSMGLFPLGEQGITPENLEAMYGPELGVRIMLGLHRAADRDFRGVDIDGIPWRMPNVDAFPILERTFDIMMVLGHGMLLKMRGEM